MDKEQLSKLSTDELRDLYWEKFHDILPSMFTLSTDEEMRKAAIDALLSGKKFKIDYPDDIVL